REAVASLPVERRKVVTSHDAFGYFSAAYGIEFHAPVGVSTEVEASAGDVARLIRQIKKEKILAVFVENISDRRLLDQIIRETGARIGGTLYSDALSKADGPAGSYLGMMRHNIRVLVAAVRK
ncbi:MAG: zinc ABC transporter substrate-binding protein, partial [Candidatus Thiodiazotropha endolucinida]